MTDKILKLGDPCPCCGCPIKTSDPEKLMLLSWVSRLAALKSRPETGAAGQV